MDIERWVKLNIKSGLQIGEIMQNDLHIGTIMLKIRSGHSVGSKAYITGPIHQ